MPDPPPSSILNYFKRLLPGSNQVNNRPKKSETGDATRAGKRHNPIDLSDPASEIKTTETGIFSPARSRNPPADHIFSSPILPDATIPINFETSSEIAFASPNPNSKLRHPQSYLSTDHSASLDDLGEIARHTPKRTRYSVVDDVDDEYVARTPKTRPETERSPYTRSSARKPASATHGESPDVLSRVNRSRVKSVEPVVVSDASSQNVQGAEDMYKLPLAFDEDDDSDYLPDAEWLTKPKKSPTSVESISGTSSPEDTTGLRRSSRRKTTMVLFANESYESDSRSNKVNASLDDRDRSQFSLAKLLNEKINRDKSGFDLEMLKSKDMFLVEDDDDDNETSNYDRGNITNKLVAANQRDRITQLLNASDECVPDPTYPSLGDGRAMLPVPSLNASDCAGDSFAEKLSNLAKDPAGLQVIFDGNWIDENQRRGWKLSVPVSDWLFSIVAYHTDHGVVYDASCILKKALETKMASSFALPAWTFSYDRLCRVFSAYGAPDEILKDEFLLTPLMKNADARTVEKDLKKKSPISIPNVRHLFQILATSVQYRMHSYAKGELAQIVFLLLKISLDVQVREVAWEIEVVITKCYEGMAQSEENWVHEAKDLATRIATLTNGVRAYECSILEKLPVHQDRDVWFRSRLACLFLFPNSPDRFGADPIQYGDLLYLFAMGVPENVFHLDASTDYPHLSLTVQIMEFAMSDEKEMGRQRKDVIRLIEQMKSFHGKIVDSRAAFLDRTVLKDYLQRLYIRLHFQVCHNKTTDGVNRQRTLFQTAQFTRNIQLIE